MRADVRARQNIFRLTRVCLVVAIRMPGSFAPETPNLGLC